MSECGCGVVVIGTDDDPCEVDHHRISYCPLHAGAKRLLEAARFTIEPLKSAIKLLDEEGYNNDTMKGKKHALKELTEAITAASKEGKNV